MVKNIGKIDAHNSDCKEKLVVMINNRTELPSKMVLL